MSTKILVIEDSKALRDVISDTLLENGLADEVLEASDGLEGFKQLIRHTPSLVICDIVMPQIDGFRFLEMKATRDDLKDIPVVMLTAKDDVEVKVQALARGAVDYITKPFEEPELLARLKVHLQIKTLQDELRHANQLLEKLSVTDSLTAIYNRRYLMEVLEREFLRAQRYGATFSVVLIDIDHFKQVNDHFGHQMGDFVLREFAQLVFRQLRATDIIARYGGEEFVLLLPDTDVKGAGILIERIRKLIEKYPFRREHSFARVTISAGVVNYPSPDIQGVDDIIKLADYALYQAKEQGRNMVKIVASGTK